MALAPVLTGHTAPRPPAPPRFPATELDGLFPVRGLAHDLETRFGAQQEPQSLANDRVIVGDQDFEPGPLHLWTLDAGWDPPDGARHDAEPKRAGGCGCAQRRAARQGIKAYYGDNLPKLRTH